MSRKHFVGLDLGTTKVCAVVARPVGEAAEIARMKPLLDGREIMQLLGIEPGPRVGEVLAFLLDQQIEGNIGTREQAVAVVKEHFVQ